MLARLARGPDRAADRRGKRAQDRTGHEAYAQRQKCVVGICIDHFRHSIGHTSRRGERRYISESETGFLIISGHPGPLNEAASENAAHAADPKEGFALHAAYLPSANA